MDILTTGPSIGYANSIYNWYKPIGSLLQTSTSSYVASLEFLKTTRQRTPHFYKLKRSGAIIPYTSFAQYRQTAYTPSWENTSVTLDGVQTETWSPHPIFPSDLAFLTETQIASIASQYLDDDLLLSALSSIYERSWDALTFLAELKETLLMFRGVLNRLLSFLSSVPTGQSVSAAWLEWRYGWRPLIADLQAINDVLNGKHKMSGILTERKGYSLSSSTTTTADYSLFSIMNGEQYRLVQNVNVSARGSVALRASLPSVRLNPIVTAYELVPFSFILDWVVNIGSALKAASLRSVSTELTAAVGVHIEVERLVTFVPGAWAPGWGGSVSGGCSGITEYSVRVPATPPYMPSFSVNLDVSKVLDLLGILIQRLQRR